MNPDDDALNAIQVGIIESFDYSPPLRMFCITAR